MTKYVYTASKLATSTAQRKLARITAPVFIANPFTIWTTDATDGSITEPTKTEYVSAWRSRDNRATRKAIKRENATLIAA